MPQVIDTAQSPLGSQFRGKFSHSGVDGLGEYRDYGEEGGEAKQDTILLGVKEDAHRKLVEVHKEASQNGEGDHHHAMPGHIIVFYLLFEGD